ncbi:lysine transporter LysE [Nocardioides marmoriginsengisoli]|uniref:Lysine transporter LysE n=1 Tax=Nocardioides marmoriginsengisoli TaxID=661483 RepID=A0A3N0CGD6_9ACTN|nr:LysE family transporter [Nocardioides marmoriginsengisoli]RNL62291.1 lysine transporter LysE [Nocardioides marmoriginsengisoli]
MLDVLLSGLVTGYAIAVPVGAVAALIITLSARTSWRVGAAAGLGVATVDGVYAAIAVVAGQAVATALEPIESVLQGVAIAALLILAALTLVHALRPASADEDRNGRTWTPLRAWLTFVGITAVNPATVVYFAAIVLGGSVDIDGPVEGIVFIAAAFAASASWQVFVASIGTGLGRWITGPRGRRTTGVVAALVIAALALKPLLSGPS